MRNQYMVSRRNHRSHHFTITIHLHLASFYPKILLKKKISQGKCSLTKLLNLNRGVVGPLVVLVLLNCFFFMTNQKFLKENRRVDYYLMLNIAVGNVSYFPLHRLNHLTQFNTKM